MLVERPVRSIVGAVADAAARWTDPDFPPRVRALMGVCDRTGYSQPVVEYGFDRLFAPLTRDAIAAVIASELGSLDALDAFVAPPGRPPARALPVGRVCIVSSRTTIGVAIVPAVFALCAKCDVLVKDREDALVGAFFATLAEELDDLRAAAAAQVWDATKSARDLAPFAAVVAFGNDATLVHIREALAPDARWIPFGSRASIGYVTRETLATQADALHAAEGAARDLVLYDGEGCLSLHALFVERGGTISSQRFTEMLAHAIERAAVEFPPSRLDPRSVAAVAAARDAAAFRAATGGGGAAYSDAEASYLALLDPPAEQPPPFLPRTLAVRTVASPNDAREYVARHALAIEAIATGAMRPDVAEMARACGAARIAAFGTLQDPPLAGYHGGRPRIAEFVRWIVDQT